MKSSPLSVRSTRLGAPPIVHSVLRSPGRPLDDATRASMEPRLGHDFSRVRVHNDAQAAESAKALNALAYTAGNNIVFGASQYSPSTPVGKSLLAHELTHVLQQNGSDAQIVQRQCSAARNRSFYLGNPNYCKDTEWTGRLHPGQECFREIPTGTGCPEGEHVCFDKTGKCTDLHRETAPSITRDPATGLCNMNWLGSCSVVHGLKDVVAPRLGAEGSVQFGLGGLLGGARFSTIAGVDLTAALNRISTLRLGARGIYMTPDRLFVGGAVGYRRIVNPVYFDVEAGLLGEILPSDRERLSKKVSAFASAGLGQEYGRSGTKFFWRLAGFLIVSDEPRAAGGVTLGAGIRFR